MNSAVRNAACPEKELLAQCARTRLDTATTQRISRLFQGHLDWEYVFGEAQENSVTPLLCRSLQTIATDQLPAPVIERLKAAGRANTVRCLFLAAELTKILDLFRSRGIHGIAYKGPALAVQAYGDMTLRQFEDLDIVIPQDEVAGANEVMLGLGYRPRFDWIVSSGTPSSLVPGEYNYRDEKRRIMVELHTERTMRHFPKLPHLEDFSQRLVHVTLNEREVPTFSPEDALIILSLHGAKDFWERFSWIADISELVQRHTNVDWGATFERAKELDAERMVRTALLLAIRLFDMPLPDEIRCKVRADRTADALASEILSRLMSRKYEALDAAGRFSFRRRMLPGNLNGWRYAIRLSVIPAEEDYEMIRLPGFLSPFYILLRPIRLLRKYGFMRQKA